MRRIPWALAALSFILLFVHLVEAQGPAARPPAQGHRAMAFLASEIGRSVSPAEALDFVNSCSIDTVVIDFAWITGVWPRTQANAVEQLCAELRRRGVRVAAMYRPRALSPGEAPIHFAKDSSGKVPPGHNELCFAHEDSRAWAAAWGDRILKALPSVEAIILYNLRAPCACPECAAGKGQAFALQFLSECRSRWSRIRPGVRLGHVGVADEYVEAVDFFCPFVAVNRTEPGRPDVPVEFPAADLARLRAAYANKWLAPLLKVCWGEQTDNSAEEVVKALRRCEASRTGFVLWYYDWLFHSDDHRYDAKTLVDALGGDWRRLGSYYAGKPTAHAADAAAALNRFRAEPGNGEALRAVIAAGDAAVDPLVTMLHDRSLTSVHRYMAANALGDIRSPRAVKPLREALTDADFNVRRCAALALGRIGDSSATAALRRLARKDPFRWRDPATGKTHYLVREDARKALRMIAAGPSGLDEVGLRKEPERFLDDASKMPPWKSPRGDKRLPWPFPGTLADQKLYNNYQQPTDVYIHAALDFLLPAGTEVRAVEDGYVAAVFTNYPEWTTHHCLLVATRQSSNQGWCYTHLEPKSFRVKAGDPVRQGQVLGQLVDFYVGKNKGADHLHLHYVRFRKDRDGKVQMESLLDPLALFDGTDMVPPQIVDPVRFVRKGSLTEFPKDSNGQTVVSDRVEIIAGISDSAYAGHQCYWMTPVVTLEIAGPSSSLCRKLVLNQRGPIGEEQKRAAGALYLTRDECAAWRKGLPAISGTFFVKLTSTDGDGVVEPSDRLHAWDTAARDTAGQRRFPNGVYTVTVRAWDLQGNPAVRSVTVRVANE